MTTIACTWLKIEIYVKKVIVTTNFTFANIIVIPSEMQIQS